MAHLSSQWSKLMNHYFIKIGRLYKERGCEFNYVASYEVQGKRLENRGEYALHTHYLARSKRQLPSGKWDWIITADEMRSCWLSVIRAELACLPDDPRLTKASCDAQLVKSSAAGYIGKYMSKGSEECRRLVEMGLTDAIPAQWWSCSKGVKAAICLWERKLSPDEVDDILHMCVRREEYAYCFDYISAVYATVGGREVCVGYSFKLSEENPLYDFDTLRKGLDSGLALLVR